MATEMSGTAFFLNRELSLLEFHARVLAQVNVDQLPLLERMRFLCIFDTNMDEFYEVRVAGLKAQIRAGAAQSGPDKMTPNQVMEQINGRAHELVTEQYRLFNEVIIPLLAEQEITFLPRRDWTAQQSLWLTRYFREEVLPVLSPMGLDPGHPFPRILNKSLNFIVALNGRDAFGRNINYAVVQVPRALPRLIRLDHLDNESDGLATVFLSSVIHAHIDELFPGMTVEGCYQFQVTRNSDLFVDEEEVDDLLRAMEGELPSRRYGDAVRLEVSDDCPDRLVQFLLDQFELEREDLFLVKGPVNLSRIGAIYDMVSNRYAGLKYTPFTQRLPDKFGSGNSVFTTISRRDVLLHHPFDSFTPVVEFLDQAARDPQVVAIKQTLYRTGNDSSVVDALLRAARAGKEVTVVIELRARFDEEANIALATRLQEAGAHVVYGVVGFKTHAKMILVVRREGKKLVRYVHLGTGNYHHATARFYTDYGLFTASKTISQEIHNVFLQLTSLGKIPKPKHVLQAPFTLQSSLVEMIANERRNAEQGKPARIIVKINSLSDPAMIEALYAASCAGVKIDLIVRGICCLRPGVKGLSENITVRSVVGRFLEHTRAVYFYNGGEEKIYCGSADWMPRNLYNRVEVAFPLSQKKVREQVRQELELYLRDNCQAWSLQPDGTYVPLQPADGDGQVCAQQELLASL
ncbi:MAG TPA: polyphosphate kinase 1 [Gammaproteobacteria bacterium]|nr:polyphosphate kinase 1 [Gammaproteobacteria bacterium]